MRDNNTGLPELITCFEKEGKFFCVIELFKNEKVQKFQFGILESGYLALRKIFQTRPFNQMPSVGYKYYFVPSYQKIDDNLVQVDIRIESGKNGKQFDFIIPKELAANLKWFIELEDFEKAKTLMID